MNVSNRKTFDAEDGLGVFQQFPVNSPLLLSATFFQHDGVERYYTGLFPDVRLHAGNCPAEFLLLVLELGSGETHCRVFMPLL